MVSNENYVVEGRFYDGRSSRAQSVRVRCLNGRVLIEGEDFSRRWPLNEVSLSPRLGSSARRLSLPDGGMVEMDDSPLLDTLFGKPSSGWVSRLEARWSLAVGALASIVLICAAAYLWGLPLAARVIADIIPTEWSGKLSDITLAALDRTSFSPTKLTPARQQEIRRKFAAWHAPEGDKPRYELFFRDGDAIGANAFALPSGNIIVTDQLVELARNDNEVLGVLSHELGHLKRRHAMRQLVQGSVVSVAAAVWFGDVSTIAGMSSALLTMHYSRDFEREADDYAADMMHANGVDPQNLGNILLRLEKDDKHNDGPEAYMSTHPVTAERIERLKSRGRQ